MKLLWKILALILSPKVKKLKHSLGKGKQLIIFYIRDILGEKLPGFPFENLIICRELFYQQLQRQASSNNFTPIPQIVLGQHHHQPGPPSTPTQTYLFSFFTQFVVPLLLPPLSLYIVLILLLKCWT